ncbi:hypothetical protein BDV93DRAFT_612302 [Ceratobasidium sp. AG-I]|nr:hypothetical protein BDV93DRAFT_612302 [Ceratobasidium sp. AG-I]
MRKSLSLTPSPQHRLVSTKPTTGALLGVSATSAIQGVNRGQPNTVYISKSIGQLRPLWKLRSMPIVNSACDAWPRERYSPSLEFVSLWGTKASGALDGDVDIVDRVYRTQVLASVLSSHTGPALLNNLWFVSLPVFTAEPCSHPPWLIPVHAQHGSQGVTIQNILQAIHDVLHAPIEESLLWILPSDDDRTRVYHAYRERVALVGDDKRGILGVDWVGEKTQFVCLARDEALARKRVADKGMWPCVYALKLKKGALTSDL